MASIVLLDDNFRTIVCAIAEGRQLFRNLQLSFAYLFAIHIPLVVTAALIPLGGLPLLYLPVHVVWLELIIHPTALLVFRELPTRQLLRQAVRGIDASGSSAGETGSSSSATGAMVSGVVIGGYVRSLAEGDVHLTPLHLDDWTLAAAGGIVACLPLAVSGLTLRHGRDRPSRWES